MNKENIVLRGVFRHAEKLEFISKSPSVRNLKKAYVRRPSFSKNEWESLTKFMREVWTKPASNEFPNSIHGIHSFSPPQTKLYRECLRDFVLLLGHSGLRVGEARMLKWSDVEFKEEDNQKYVLLRVRDGKTGSRNVVGLEWVETTLKRRQEKSEFSDLDDYIFCHPSGGRGEPGTPINTFQKAFKNMLESAGLLNDEDGEERTLYSCRHTYATFRISEGQVDIFQLATNMGCSVEILQTHYSHVIPEQFASNLARLISSSN